MPKLIVLYPPPADVTTFGTPAGAAPYRRVAELYFDSIESLQAAMASPGGQATVAHAMEISTGGPPVVLIAEDDNAV